MGVENQFTSTIEGAVFNPLTDRILTVRSLDNDLFTLPSIELESFAGILEPKLINAFGQLTRSQIRATVNYGSKIDTTPDGSLNKLFDFRLFAADGLVSEHMADSESFDELTYVPEVRDFLRRLFAEFKKTGTLLSALKQPMYIRPALLCRETDQLIVPVVEDRQGKRPRSFRLEEGDHVNNILGDIIHKYIASNRKKADIARLSADQKILKGRQSAVPVWQMDYLFEISARDATAIINNQPAQSLALVTVSDSRPPRLEESLPINCKKAIHDIAKRAMHHVITCSPTTNIEFNTRKLTGPKID